MLNNGLTVIVHEDRKAPIVTVNVWYPAGSKNKTPDKTGFAHLRVSDVEDAAKP